MDATAQLRFKKTTVVPLYYTVWNAPFLMPPPQLNPPLHVYRDIALESMEGILNIGNFELWKEHVSSRERKALASISICLVNRFESHEHMGRLERDSQDLLHRVFVCLRIIKPTPSAFCAIQFKTTESGQVDVFSFSNQDRKDLNSPGTEALNLIGQRDILTVSRIFGPFSKVVEGGPDNLRRSIQLFEEGHAAVYDPALQLLVWMMGLEAAFTSGDLPLRKHELLPEIDRRVGFHRNIYEDSGARSFIEVPPPLSVGDVIEDLIHLRNHLVHGGRPDKIWASNAGRSWIGGETLPYADVLREAASFILRKSILSFLASPQV